MIVFPLGLGTKLRWAPMITTGIIALWIAHFIFDPFRDKISQDLNVAAAQSGIKDTSRKLFVEYCIKTRGITTQCHEFSRLIWAGFPAKTKLQDLPKIQTFLEKEYEKSLKMKDSLKECADSSKPKRCLKYKEIFWKFSKFTQAMPAPKSSMITSLPSYAAYAKASTDFGNRMVKICQTNQCLIKGNVRLAPILLAQVRHGGFLHLLGNLIAFLIFGSYVEQRLRPIIYGFFLFLSGSLGMFIHVLVWGTYDSFIIGGSTIVSGALGLFYVLFFDKNLCMRVFIPRKLYLGTNFFAPVKYSIPLMFIMGDIAGGLNSGYNEFGLPRVAHFAHLSSFGIGAFLGLLLLLMEKSKDQPLYRNFQGDFKALQNTYSTPQSLVLADQILACDPQRDDVRLYSLHYYFKSLSRSEHQFPKNLLIQGNRFCNKHLSKILQGIASNKWDSQSNPNKITLKSLVSLLDHIPPKQNMSKFFFQSSPEVLLKTALILVIDGSIFHGLRFFDLYLYLYPESKICRKIKILIDEELFEFFVSYQESPQKSHLENYGKIIEYFHYNPQSPLKHLAESYFSRLPTNLKIGQLQ